MSEKKLYTVSELVNALGVSPTTIRRWDKAGKLPSSRHPINNYRVYPEEQVKQLMEDMQLSFEYKDKGEKKEVSSQNIFLNGNTAPYFSTKRGKLYNLDVLDFLKQIETGSIDLIFADPPYNIKKAAWDTFSNQKEYVDWSMQWINEAHRILTPHGSLYICGFSEILADLNWSASHLFKGCKWLVWFYRNKANLGNDWGRSHESILHFRKSRKFIFNTDEVRIPYNQHTLKYPKRPQAKSSQYSNGKKKYIWEPHPKGAKPKDVFEIPTLSNSSWERYSHPTQKPVELLKKFILGSSNEDSIVVDPFGGSGSTYAVCEAFKRSWIGNELSEEYCKMIQQRITDQDHIQRIAGGKDEIDAIERRSRLRL